MKGFGDFIEKAIDSFATSMTIILALAAVGVITIIASLITLICLAI